MWKEKMRVKESRAEYRLLAAFQRAGLSARAGGMFYQKTIILKATTPDFVWDKPKIAVYLDGPPHEKSRQIEKDEDLRGELERRGWTVLVFKYMPPLSDKELENILVEIGKALPE